MTFLGCFTILAACSNSDDAEKPVAPVDKAPRNQDALLTEAEKLMYQDKADYYKRTGIDRRKY